MRDLFAANPSIRNVVAFQNWLRPAGAMGVVSTDGSMNSSLQRAAGRQASGVQSASCCARSAWGK